ncbi:hypothetical protein SUGI_0816190 [Cryptomeria japonica]|uniref:putative disease resistance protein RGA3 n=1 Tax=Cryptomeria japonica TaxID=3369 RepID=UPI0024147E71|nr:putative disease resistance protein RGA3 [Cryptomeria japonica]GLJ39916.1 hypothetical protein SUGI_0816190 [Cryptomeria japonica]
MAFLGEAAAGKICEMAVEMAVQKLTEEANLLLDFSGDFSWLKNNLTYVRDFLQDADQQAPHKEGVKHWVENIRVISLLAEDICEECAIESMYGNNARACSPSCNQLIFRYKIGRKIKDIKERMRSIIEDVNKLKLLREVCPTSEASPSTSHSGARKKSYLLPSVHSVGIESKVDDMLRLLDNNASPIIAVVGMGGIGKSYLLQHVYNSVKERYDKCIWLSFSQSYSISTLQCDIASHLGLGQQIRSQGISPERAAELIHENLKGKRYLVVLDDVWETREDLLSKLGLLIGDNVICKILVSTRNREVCTILNAHIYEMQFLSESESWSLFCFYAFKGNEAPNHQLEEVGRDILKQCGNLPLAIKMVAASLPKTTMPREWESKLHRIKEVVIADDDQIMPILRLSYFSLHARLKACFAYLSFFPKVEQINCEYLVYLWIAEGYIPAGEGQWDVAWDCINQLANLCLLQLWEQYEDRPGCKLTNYCRTHDLLHDLAINISKENKCIFSVEEACKVENGDCCRILLGTRDVNEPPISERRLVCLRTLSLSHNWRITSIPAKLFTAMRGLRVLDLSGTGISKLPRSLGKMKLLKVLNLNDTKIENVPECVRHLKSLLFLALPQRCQILPVWINEVKCLQHLECKGVTRVPKGISKLTALRTLRSNWLDLSNEGDEFMRPEDFVKITQLQELSIDVNKEMDSRIEEGILVLLVKMRRLTICNSTENELELPKKMTAMKDLESLILWRFAVGSWICDMANLRELELTWHSCNDYPELQTMPNLVRLELSGNDKCKELPKAFGQRGGFRHLRFFKIDCFNDLEEIPELEEGAMSCLEEFHLCNCTKVKKVGEGFERLKRFKLFYYKRTDKLEEIFRAGGEYWNKIKVINPHVKITSY